MKRLTLIIALIIASVTQLSAQHRVGVSAGYGMATFRAYPVVEERPVWGRYTGAVSWRYYGDQKYVGAVGIDLEYLQRGFSYAPYASIAEEGEVLQYYTRKVNSLMLPLVWQPCLYFANNRARLFVDALVYLTCNLNSTYTNEIARDLGYEDWEGKYNFKTPRDNRFGYGVGGGGGVAILFGQVEVELKARYYFGYSDIVRYRDQYHGNNNDGSENPFTYTPQRSQLDNTMISVGVNYRFDAKGYKEWGKKYAEKIE